MWSEAEYEAARSGAILVQRVERGRVMVTGADRRTYLHAMLTNDIAGLAPGRGCYAAWLTAQGRMIADMKVLDVGDALLLETELSLAPDIVEKLEQFVFTEEVALHDATAGLAQLGVHGPSSARVVAAALDEMGVSIPEADLAGLSEHSNLGSTLGGAMLVVAGSRDFAPKGFDVYFERDAEESLSRAIEAAGAVPASMETADVLRVERGRPLFGRDMDESTIPLEAGIEPRAVSFTKGCYPGQEVIIRVLHRGQGRVARKLVGLVLEAGTSAPPGSIVEGGDRKDGVLTSQVFSPALGTGIALAYVHRDLAVEGTRLSVRAGEGQVAATVSRLPFVDDPPGR